jgi:hypothetical protein
MITPDEQPAEIRDYNGAGEWSSGAIRERYFLLARSLGQKELRDLTPRQVVKGSVHCVYPVMDEVIAGIKAGDAACIEIGIEFIERAGKQPFGRILHANTARALRHATLNASQIDRLRTRILAMLVKAQVPHEFHEYAKLLRHIGIGPGWSQVVAAAVATGNPYVMQYVRYFEKHAGAK